MPLPDERPRQSVANLIGRFEQKRHSFTGIVAPPLPRSTSVASHITGDSAKEEIKEKREWPPKSTIQDEKRKISLPSTTSLRPPPSQPTSLPIAEAAAPPAKPVAKDPASAPPTASESVKASKTPSTSVKSSPARKPTSTPTKTPTPRTTKKSPVRSPALTSSNSQPLRPQHTGTSTKSAISTPSNVRHIQSNSKSTPSHMSRPKTPGFTAGTSRPKTPSAGSGLFAPTAASLAKARNAVPAVPTPIKKATLSSGAADRLSKPTAASISKVRAPSLQETSPARGGKVARGVATRGIMKPRVGLAPARMKEMTAAKKNGNGVKVAEAAAAVGSEDAESQEATQQSDERDENGHDLDASGFLAEPETGSFTEETLESCVAESEDVSYEVADEGISHDEGVDVEEAETSTTVPPETSPSPTPAKPLHELESEPEVEEAHPDDAPAEPHYSDESGASVEEQHVQEVKQHVQAGIDIHDIVNLLETTPVASEPKARPLNMDVILDYAPDIPDEE